MTATYPGVLYWSVAVVLPKWVSSGPAISGPKVLPRKADTPHTPKLCAGLAIFDEQFGLCRRLSARPGHVGLDHAVANDRTCFSQPVAHNDVDAGHFEKIVKGHRKLAPPGHQALDPPTQPRTHLGPHQFVAQLLQRPQQCRHGARKHPPRRMH